MWSPSPPRRYRTPILTISDSDEGPGQPGVRPVEEECHGRYNDHPHVQYLVYAGGRGKDKRSL